jgi:agmatine deiminase
MTTLNITPSNEGYFFPAEWAEHEATWLSYPHNENSWPDRIDSIYNAYHQFIIAISKKEKVHINVCNTQMLEKVKHELALVGADFSKIFLHIHPTNDAWCRDHGPAFLINPQTQSKILVKWNYNAWGGKYPADLDNQIPYQIATHLNLPIVEAGIIMEGGSVDFNGNGTILTTTSCLLNENRNPLLTQPKIEEYLEKYYGVKQILWLGDGIEGDDTDGHIDDITRFVNEDTVITCVEQNKEDFNHLPLKENLESLKKMRLLNGKQLNIVELPMPSPLFIDEQRVPASYANFYICNAGVMVPIFKCKEDDLALQILSSCFKDRPVIGIDSTDMIWGLGSWHCLSQQEPKI